jgi:hypothetical protein
MSLVILLFDSPGIKPRALRVLGKCSITEQYYQLLKYPYILLFEEFLQSIFLLINWFFSFLFSVLFTFSVPNISTLLFSITLSYDIRPSIISLYLFENFEPFFQ